MKTRLLAPALLAAAAQAQAHTGHGHDDFDSLHGLLHALSEPDHLAMLALGLAVTAWAAPRVLRGLRALRQRLLLRRSRRDRRLG